MELFATRGYFFCRYCGSFHFPDAQPDEGIRVISEAEQALVCSVCSQALASAMLDETHLVRYCRNCRGVLLARTGFAAVVEKRRAWATGTPAAPVPLDKSELERKMRCAACAGQMATHPYYGPGNVVIDSCEPCALVWVDFGELKQIVDAPGRDRGTREVPRPVQGEAVGSSITGARVVGPGGASGSAGITDIFSLLESLF